jgi:putative ABC transport system permease protein
MFRNYWKVALRSLLKRKGFTLINMLGLATGMAVCMLIVVFIRQELSYDRFEENGDRVYRLVLERKYPGRSSSYAIIPLSVGEAVKRESPEVEASTGFQDFTGTDPMLIKIGDRRFEEQRVLTADSSFFRVFPMQLLTGDAATALQKPDMAVLSASTATRLFGSVAAAIGKTFDTETKHRFMVSGVCKDWPANSHMGFDMLLSAVTFPTPFKNYTGFSTYTYLLLHNGASAASVEAMLPRLIEKYASGEVGRNFGMSFQQFQAAGNGYHYYLQPLARIHLDSDLQAELRPNGSEKAVYIFAIIAAFILGIACINFVNLSTARSVERAREVGVRKTFGSGQRSLVLQFLLESVLVSVVSMVLALGLVWVFLPMFSRLAGEDFAVANLLNPLSVFALVAFGLVVGLVAGLYPAFVLSSFQPIKVLKGKFHSNKYGVALRNALVVFQFAISILLIICTIVVNQQMTFMLGDALGFRQDHVIEIQRSDLVDGKNKAFRQELGKIAGVERVGGASTLPGEQGFFGIAWQVLGSKESMTGRGIIVDDAFAGTLGLTLKEGRFFSNAFGTDSLSVVLNEKAVAALGLREPVVGTRLTTTTEFYNPRPDSFYTYTVVGVVRDFHYQTLHQAIEPLVITNASKFGGVTNLTAVRINGTDLHQAIGAIEHVWRQFVPDHPLHYGFLDENLAAQYKAEQTLQRIFTVFSALAIFIACIGLLGLAAYATQQRMREMSIRKVLGAGRSSIVRLLSKDFIRLVSLSAFIAFPAAWLAMHAWLQGFAYRIGLSWWVFVLAWLACLLITLVTISVQAIRAAAVNPVKVLRSE